MLWQLAMSRSFDEATIRECRHDALMTRRPNALDSRRHGEDESLQEEPLVAPAEECQEPKRILLARSSSNGEWTFWFVLTGASADSAIGISSHDDDAEAAIGHACSSLIETLRSERQLPVRPSFLFKTQELSRLSEGEWREDLR
jgi:hypothetical protein